MKRKFADKVSYSDSEDGDYVDNESGTDDDGLEADTEDEIDGSNTKDDIDNSDTEAEAADDVFDKAAEASKWVVKNEAFTFGSAKTAHLDFESDAEDAVSKKKSAQIPETHPHVQKFQSDITETARLYCQSAGNEAKLKKDCKVKGKKWSTPFNHGRQGKLKALHLTQMLKESFSISLIRYTINRKLRGNRSCSRCSRRRNGPDMIDTDSPNEAELIERCDFWEGSQRLEDIGKLNSLLKKDGTLLNEKR